MHTPFIGVNIFHFDIIDPLVSCRLFFFSFLGRLVVYVFLWEYLFVLGPYNLEFLSILQKDDIFCYHLIPESLDVLQSFLLLLLLCNPFPFDFLSCPSLYLSPCFLSCMLNMIGLCCFF